MSTEIAPPKPVATNTTSGYLPTLDGWRAIAVLLVILSHTAESKAGIKWYQGQGGFGVSIFFALSGFLICSRLLAECDRTGRIDLAGFYVRRVFRILPPVWTYLAGSGGWYYRQRLLERNPCLCLHVSELLLPGKQ